MRINTNIASLTASNAIAKTDWKMAKTVEKLSTGLRINRAGDDAAGLAISEKMRAQIRSLDVVKRNIMDGISLIQTGEGALEEVHSMLHRMKELAVQSANGIYDTNDISALKAEGSQLKEQIEDILAKANFNGVTLLQGGTTINLQTGINAGDSIALTTGTLDNLTDNLGDISNPDVLAALDEAVKAVSDLRGTMGAAQNRLEHTYNSVTNSVENLTAAESRIRDADMAAEMATYSKQQVLVQAGMSIAAQANQKTSLVLKLLG